MRIVVNCRGQEFYGYQVMSDCDYAVVDVSPELVARIQKQAMLADAVRKQDSSLDELRFSTRDITVYRHDTLGKALDAALGEGFKEIWDQEWVPLPEDFDLTPFKPEAIEFETFSVWPTGGTQFPSFYWWIRPYGTEIRVRTAELCTADLEEALNKAGIAA